MNRQEDEPGKDMSQYLEDTREMVCQGKYPDALERILWFHEHALEFAPSMYGVRLSFALKDWKNLGEVYPPAKAALVEIRDRKEKIVAEGNGSEELFDDVAALNETLGENERTLALFEEFDRTLPDVAERYWQRAKGVVIEAKRYDLAIKYIGSFADEFAEAKEFYDFNLGHYDDPRFETIPFKTLNENSLVMRSLTLIEVAEALGEFQAAEEIRNKALSLVQDERLHQQA